MRNHDGELSAESSGDELCTPPEPQTDKLVGHGEDTSSLLNILKSIPGTQDAYGDDEPSGDEEGPCECQSDHPTHQ